MRYLFTTAFVALLYTMPATARTLEAKSELTARVPIPNVNCVPNSPIISVSTVVAQFDVISKTAPYEQCGGLWAPTIHVDGKRSVEASADGRYKFYICNNDNKNRCITLGPDKRKRLEDASRQCGGRTFWIRDNDGWSFGVDPIHVKECGNF